MSDYDSDYVYSITVPPKTTDVYYENITLIPSRFRGAIFTDYETKQQIDFEIKGPNNTRVYFNTTHQCIFDFNVTEKGRYSINFSNRYIAREVNLTITMSSGQNNMLRPQDLTLTEKKIDSIDAFLKRFNVEYKFNRNLHKERKESKIYVIFTLI